MIETKSMTLQGVVQRFLAGVTKRWMPDVVRQSKRFGEIDVKAKRLRQSARDLRDLECVCEPAAKVITGRVIREAREDLSFSGKTAKGARVQDARSISCEGCPIKMGWLAVGALCKLSIEIDRDCGWERSEDWSV